MTLARVLLICFLTAAGGVALAQPAPPPRAAWDSRGWVLLGEREVRGHGQLERDHINVGRFEGRFSKLTVVVEDSDLELVGFTVKFGKGDPFTPMVNHFFREGQRTRVIEFPENAWGSSDRVINGIDFNYRNLPGEGHARVQVWAWRTGDAVAPPPPPPAPAWDPRGWVLLGETRVHGHGKLDHDRIAVSPQEGRFAKLTVVVEDSDLEMVDFVVGFSRGDAWRPGISHFFRENQRTRVIEIPENAWGEARRINSIDFSYRNIPGEGHAKVQVWAKPSGEAAPPPVVWESHGWTMLGETRVNGHGKLDHDRVVVNNGTGGRYSKVTIVVTDSDLEMVDFSIQFMHGDPYHPEVKHFFREGQRTRVVQLPESSSGRGERVIHHIDFAYRNIPGEGHARVQVWAQ